MQISLIGMPGVGKTSVGRQLARLLSLGFIDCDEQIESRLGCSIPSYFENHGEAAFRRVEEDVIAEFAGRGDTVFSTGGGSVLKASNRRALHDESTVVHLRATTQSLLGRAKAATRPLLKGASLIDRLETLLHERSPLYAMTAHMTIDVDNLSVSAVAALIADSLAEQAREQAREQAHEPQRAAGRPVEIDDR